MSSSQTSSLLLPLGYLLLRNGNFPSEMALRTQYSALSVSGLLPSKTHVNKRQDSSMRVTEPF